MTREEQEARYPVGSEIIVSYSDNVTTGIVLAHRGTWIRYKTVRIDRPQGGEDPTYYAGMECDAAVEFVRKPGEDPAPGPFEVLARALGGSR